MDASAIAAANPALTHDLAERRIQGMVLKGRLGFVLPNFVVASRIAAPGVRPVMQTLGSATEAVRFVVHEVEVLVPAMPAVPVVLLYIYYRHHKNHAFH